MNYLRSTLLLCLFSFPLVTQADDWAFEIEPYVFLNNISGDASAGRIDDASIDMDFGDILDDLDSTLMIHFEVLYQSRWGFIADYSFMTLKDDLSLPFDTIVTSKTRQGVLELDVFYRTDLGKGVLDYTVGVRWWDNDIDVKVDTNILPGSPRVEVEEDWFDLVVGLRWQTPISESWTFLARGDVGSFGTGADFTSQLKLGARYTVNESFVIDLQYKGTWVDYDDGDRGQPGYFAYDTVTYGPLIGGIFRF